MGILLQARDLHYKYPNSDTPVLKGLCLDIHSEEELVLLGANQTGKSTLAKILAGLLEPTKGEVRFYPKKGVYPKAAIVFQNPENQIIGNTVEEDIAFGPGNLCLPPEQIAQRVEEALEICDLKDLRYRDVLTLSGGEKQRVAIAGAIALRPICIILDEATAMLDQPAKEEIRLSLEKIKAHYGIAILKITNSPWEALTAERVSVIHQGVLAVSGPPKEVLWETNPLEEWGLVIPPLQKIARKLVDAGYMECRWANTPEELADIYVNTANKG